MSNSRDVFMFKLPLPFLLFLDDSDGTPKEVDQPGETTHVVKVSNKDSFLYKKIRTGKVHLQCQFERNRMAF